MLTSLAGIGGYFHVIPGGGMFLRYGRVMGAFQDPNVFAPFLVLPIALLFRDILTRRLRNSLVPAALLLILLLAEFLAFSRAAWGMTVVALVLVGAVRLRQRAAPARPPAHRRLSSSPASSPSSC